MQVFIERVVPEAERSTWTGAPDSRVMELQQLAGRPLPPFYRWFLATAGAAFPHAPLGYERQDLRVQTVLEAYRTGLFAPDSRFLLIGRVPDPVMPELVLYDLDGPCRDDAMVLTRPESGPPMRRTFETLREKLAWGMLRKHRVTRCPQRCEGRLMAQGGGDVLEQLQPVLARQGFTSPILTGPYCGLYERDDAAMTCVELIEDAQGDLQIFQLGGPDMGTLRRILGEIRVETGLAMRITRWKPPLPA